MSLIQCLIIEVFTMEYWMCIQAVAKDDKVMQSSPELVYWIQLTQ